MQTHVFPPVGGIEAGGTKMVCSIGYPDGTILKRESFPTEMPETTIPKLIQFFVRNPVTSLCLASFGPIQLNKNAKDYGNITSTPKLAWTDIPILPIIRDALEIPVVFETDVDAAAYGELMIGAGKGLSNIVYITIGTGVGGGVVSEGRIVHGLLHPEIGHMLVRAHPYDGAPDGFCPYHKGCLEGVASGPAILKRTGIPAQNLPQDHPVWNLVAYYIAQCAVNLIVTVSPERIILGGGVMKQTHLFAMIRRNVTDILNGYIRSDVIVNNIDSYIVATALGDDSAAAGCLILAGESPL
ncbi:MAG: ROK family protein [Oscillospiraceae bacterium]|jgi:fructokinase|nr:ROK family protein [Oscillospiraceae bacterium]